MCVQFFLTTGVQARFCKGNAEAQGYAEAQYNLGNLYANGQGVPKDYAKAIYWLKKAAEQGNKTAKRDLQRAEREDRAQQRRRPRP
jgi:TPR repeat protein